MVIVAASTRDPTIHGSLALAATMVGAGPGTRAIASPATAGGAIHQPGGPGKQIPAGPVEDRMKRVQVTVPWREGLHLRRAAQVVKVAQRFRSSLSLKCGGRIADLRSILGVLALCAVMGATLEVEAIGDDEQEAVQTVEREFSP